MRSCRLIGISWMVACLLATMPAGAAQAFHLTLKPIGGGVVKGPADTYYPRIFETYQLRQVRAFSLSEFAEDASLRRQNNSNVEEVATGFYNRTVEAADTLARTHCEELFSDKGISRGYYLVDQFDVVSADTDGVRRVIASGNILCMTRR